jgi:hypothetical protein
VSEMGHKRGQWGHMHGDEGLCFMSCDARMHGVANGTIESAVMLMGEDPGRSTVYSHCFDRKLCTITAIVP